MRTWLALAIIGLLGLLGCGGPAATQPATNDRPTASSGGETAPAVDPTAATLPSTTPIPVPRPAIPRERLSAPLQRVWELVESAVEVRPPDPPTEATREAIQAWASGPFHDWVGRRSEAVHAVEEAAAPLTGATGAERGIAAALFGYLYEETAAGARGAPVPADLAADAELLHVYEQALLESLQPYARASAESYAACVRAFTALHDDAWTEWTPYCLERGREVVEIYQLAPPAAPPASAP